MCGPSCPTGSAETWEATSPGYRDALNIYLFTRIAGGTVEGF